MTIALSLKPNRNLLDANFQSYKLSLDPLPILKKDISAVGKVRYNDATYGHLQVLMTAGFNQLWQDPWDLHTLFYVSAENVVCCISLTSEGRLSEERRVWEIPDQECGTASLTFPSQDLCLLTNGKKSVYVLRCRNRHAGQPWTLEQTIEVEGEVRPPTLLLHSIQLPDPVPTLHFLLLHIAPAPQGQADSFLSILEWITLVQDQGGWTQSGRHTLTSPSFPRFTIVEHTGAALYVASEKPFTFLSKDVEMKEEDDQQASNNVQQEESKPLYTYLQTPDDITLGFSLPEGTHKSEISVKFGLKHLTVQLMGEVALDSRLCRELEVEACTWTYQDGRLEVILTKLHPGCMWPQILEEGDGRGREIPDPELAAEFHAALCHLVAEKQGEMGRRPGPNLQQLEECDISSESVVLERLDPTIMEPSHRADLLGRNWLFGLQSTGHLCLRHDVDGLVWEIQPSPGLHHVATFPAFGYVQASKQDRKFSCCPPDFSYAAICDTARHIFIYHQPTKSAECELRNRKSGSVVQHVARQHLAYLDDCSAILGLRASPSCLFALGPNTIYAVKIS